MGPAGAALTTAVGQQSANVTTASATYITSASGASTTLSVVAGDRVIVIVTSTCSADSNNNGCLVSFQAATGANVWLTASDSRAAGLAVRPGAGSIAAMSTTHVVTVPVGADGTATFTTLYRVGSGGATATFTASSIIVQKLAN
jgi:hypothetical protein